MRITQAAEMTNVPDDAETGPHPVDQVPPPARLLILGLQHLFIMYAGAVAVPLIVGPAVGLDSHDVALLVSADLLVSGIASVLQSVGVSKIIGVRMPVVAGATFTVLNPMIIIANEYGGRTGLPYVYGALLISGVFGLIIAKPFSMVLRFFPPLVTGTVIAMIGLSLIGADIGLIAGNKFSNFVAANPVGNHNLLIVAVALSFGLIPTIQPDFYQHFPQNFQVIFGSSITSTVIVVFVLNLVFNHWHLFPREREGAVETALDYGAVAPSDAPVRPEA